MLYQTGRNRSVHQDQSCNKTEESKMSERNREEIKADEWFEVEPEDIKWCRKTGDQDTNCQK